MAGIGAETECSADVLDTIFVRHDMDERMSSLRILLSTIGIRVSENISCIFYDRELHAEAETEVRYTIFTGIADSGQHTVDTALSKSTGNNDSVYITEYLFYIFRSDIFRRNPFDIYISFISDRAVLKCFNDTDIGIVKSYIFTNESEMGSSLGI